MSFDAWLEAPNALMEAPKTLLEAPEILLGGETYVRTDGQTGQNPPILKDIAPFGAAAQKGRPHMA